jgi:Tol biopolymer transport system component
MYVADISGTTPVLYQLTTAGTTGSTYISDSKVFTPDGKSVVYGYSTTSYSSALDVRIQPIGSSTTPQVLQSSGYNQAILAY